MCGVTDNKMHRIRGMIKILFGDEPENHKNIRYQLVTATVATLLEANAKKVKNAVLLVIVFKKKGCYSERKIADNKADIENFLLESNAKEHGAGFEIPTAYGKENDIKMHFQYMEINLD